MPRSRIRSADGSASVEFLAGAVLLLVPLVYLVLTLAALEAAAYATDGAARGAALVLSRHPDRLDLAEATLAVALTDFGVDPDSAATAIRCEPVDCAAPSGARLTVTVRVDVPLPLVPPGLPVSVPVDASATLPVARFPGSGG